MELYEWYNGRIEEGVHMTGPLLKNAASELHAKYYPDDEKWVPSEGWLHGWKYRHNIRLKRWPDREDEQGEEKRKPISRSKGTAKGRGGGKGGGKGKGRGGPSRALT